MMSEYLGALLVAAFVAWIAGTIGYTFGWSRGWDESSAMDRRLRRERREDEALAPKGEG